MFITTKLLSPTHFCPEEFLSISSTFPCGFLLGITELSNAKLKSCFSSKCALSQNLPYLIKCYSHSPHNWSLILSCWFYPQIKSCIKWDFSSLHGRCVEFSSARQVMRPPRSHKGLRHQSFWRYVTSSLRVSPWFVAAARTPAMIPMP